jgi:anion-transporting  ArsA/GET3 family ATPase
MRALIENHRVIVCTGSGGVGKTTTSAALGVAAARMGKRVLVLTIDPARRLATTLGIANDTNDVRVPGQHYAGELWAGLIDPARIFAEYIERHAKDREVANRLFNNAFYQQLSTTLSGSQDFTSLSKLCDAASCGKYDLVILDTPPAAHAVDFLRAPERLNAVFDSSVVSLFMGRSIGLGFAATAWKQGVKVVLGALTLLTGSAFVATFKDFFSAIDAIAPDLRETNLRGQRLLLDPATAFVLISSLDAAKIQEGEAFYAELAVAGYHLRKVILNRAWPQWTPPDVAAQAAVDQALHARGEPALANLYAELSSFYMARRAPRTAFADVLTVPEMDEEVVGLPALEQLAARLVIETELAQPIARHATAARRSSTGPEPSRHR